MIIIIDMILASYGAHGIRGVLKVQGWGGVHVLMREGSQRKRSCANRGEHPVSDDEYRLQSGQKQSRGHGHCF